jgi:hypothetical protein
MNSALASAAGTFAVCFNANPTQSCAQTMEPLKSEADALACRNCKSTSSTVVTTPCMIHSSAQPHYSKQHCTATALCPPHLRAGC